MAIYALSYFYDNQMNDFKKSEQYYLQGIQQYPQSALLSGYAMLLLEYRQYEKALKQAHLAEEVISQKQIVRGAEHTYDSLGHIYWKGFDNTEKAKFYFDKAIRVMKSHQPSWQGAIAMFTEKKNFAKMMEWKKRLLATNPHNIMLLVEIAQHYAAENYLNEAKEYYQKALDIHPHYHIALDGLAALEQ